jgi:hypothetical protein
MNFCINCGAPLSECATICSDCSLPASQTKDPAEKKRSGWHNGLIHILMTVSIIAILFFFCFLPLIRPNSDYETCCKNLRMIGFALESYSTDHSGFYPGAFSKMQNRPKVLSALTPKYLNGGMPTCPAAGRDTYSSTYLEGRSAGCGVDLYFIYCSGSNHSRLADPGFPQYSSTTGLERSRHEISNEHLKTLKLFSQYHLLD